ncbi:MAG: hypothetical protein GF364_17785, partial [Candidatus Lokiarchaeota archaeon]|nr:hypothetical protein [Candidatus Lokiarchaeota archaeon]
MTIELTKNLNIRLHEVGRGWASNSVNTTIFRYNSVYSMGNVQICAWYDMNKHVVLAKRNLYKNSP